MGGYGPGPGPGGWLDICVILGGRGERGSKKGETNEMSQGYRDVTSGYEREGRSSHASIAQGKKEGKIRSKSRNAIVQNKEGKGNQGGKRERGKKEKKKRIRASASTMT